MIVEVHPLTGRADGASRTIGLSDPSRAILACRTFRAAYPRVSITVIGVPSALVTRFHRCFDEYIEYPAYPGLSGREPVGNPTLTGFVADRQRRYRTGPVVHTQTEVHR